MKGLRRKILWQKRIIHTKKISGVYDTATHTIESEADKRDILKELEDFEGSVIEVSITVKEETDLSNEE